MKNFDPMKLKGVDLDETIAREIFGIKVLGRTTCAFPPDDRCWTAYPGSPPPEQWMCHAETRPVFLEKCHCAFIRNSERKYLRREKKFKGHYGMCLGVVEEYSTDLQKAFGLLEKLKPQAFHLAWNCMNVWSAAFVSKAASDCVSAEKGDASDTETAATLIARAALSYALQKTRRKP